MKNLTFRPLGCSLRGVVLSVNDRRFEQNSEGIQLPGVTAEPPLWTESVCSVCGLMERVLGAAEEPALARACQVECLRHSEFEGISVRG